MQHAESKLDKFNTKMEKRNERARQKAIEKWMKRNPGKSAEGLDVSALDSSYFENTDSDGRNTFLTNSKSFGINGT